MVRYIYFVVRYPIVQVSSIQKLVNSFPMVCLSVLQPKRALAGAPATAEALAILSMSVRAETPATAEALAISGMPEIAGTPKTAGRPQQHIHQKK
jgi:hypothetical protein